MKGLAFAASLAIFTAVMIAVVNVRSGGQQSPFTVRLWAGDAPGAGGGEDADIPSITIYSPPLKRATGAAIVICPGGGYGILAAHEGKPIAQWLNSLGITGIVLKYRLGPKYHHPIMQNDVARALRLARANAKEWKIDAKRVGVLGFSAGGHLASTAATHFDDGNSAASDPVDHFSSRPDVAVLIYPVITMTDPFTHAGSRLNLLGDHPSADLIEQMSNEKQVTTKTPSSFLVHTADDAVVPVENALLYTLACRKMHVPVELHVFEHGPHGFGLGGGDPILGTWPDLCAKWLNKHGFLKP